MMSRRQSTGDAGEVLRGRQDVDFVVKRSCPTSSNGEVSHEHRAFPDLHTKSSQVHLIQHSQPEEPFVTQESDVD
jgi:hypothetical protein